MRGKTECVDYVRAVTHSSCCMESGTDLKISLELSELPRGTPGRMMEETMIAFCLEGLARQVCRSGGVDSTVVERLFSITRALGLRHGYRLELTKYRIQSILSHFIKFS